MKCINRLISSVLCLSLALCLVSCKNESDDDYVSYDMYESSDLYSITNNREVALEHDFFAKNLAKATNDDIGVSQVDSQVAYAGAAYNLSTNQVLYAQNIHQQIYPASTTKIMTCYVACLYGDLDSMITVSENAVIQPDDSSVCDLKAGDVISLRDLLYGLMLRSGNDAAIAIAEGISGDVTSFAELMNKTAHELGATNTNFVNPNGLHDENHYTTSYDMYLILNKAILNKDFYNIFSCSNYTANYTSKDETKTQEWKTTTQYFTGKTSAPAGFSILGGKTGTTGAAGYCLV